MRYFFSSWLLLLAFVAHCQDIVPVFQTGHQQAIDFIDVHRADNLLLTADQRTVMLWNTQTGRQLRLLSFPDRVYGAVFCLDGREIAVLHHTTDGQLPTLQFFDTNTGLRRSSVALDWPRKPNDPRQDADDPLSLVRNADGSRLAAVVDDYMICEVQSASRLKSALVRIPEHRKAYSSISLQFTAFSLQFTAQPGIYFVAYQSAQDSLEVALLDNKGIVRQRKVASPEKDNWPVASVSNRAGSLFYLLEKNGVVTRFDQDLVPKKIMQKKAGFVRPRPGALALSADETVLVSGLSDDAIIDQSSIFPELCNLVYLNTETYRTRQPARLACFYTNDNRRLALADNEPSRAHNERLLLYDQPPNPGNKLYNYQTQGVTLFNLSSTVPPENGLAFNKSGTIMALGQQGHQGGQPGRIVDATCQRLDLRNGRSDFNLRYRITQWLDDSVALCLSPDSSGGPDGELFKVQKRNILSGKLLDTYHESPSDFLNNGHFKRVVSPDGSLLAYANGEWYTDNRGFVNVATGPGFASVKQIVLARRAYCRQLLFTPDSRYLVMDLDSVVQVYEVATEQMRSIPIERNGLSFEESIDKLRQLAVTADSREVLYITSGESYSGPDEKGLSVADRESSQVLLAYSLADGTVRKVHRWNRSYALVSALACHPSESVYAVGFEDGLAEVRSHADHRLLSTDRSHIVKVGEVCFRPQHSQLAVLGIDGTIALVSYRTRLPALKMAHIHNPLLKTGGFALVTAQNYYLAPPTAVAQLHYAHGVNTYSFEQFDLRYNRPDKVLEALGAPDTALVGNFRRAYHKRLRRLHVDTTTLASGVVPVARIANRNELPVAQDLPTLTLHIRASDAQVPLTHLQIWVNEVPVFGSRGHRLPKRTSLSLDTTVVVTLSDGSNRIETSVTNAKGAESYRTPFFTDYTPDEPSGYRLFFVGIGINRFAEPGHNLQWSVKDIRDLTDGFAERYGTAMRIDTLLDRQVTTANVRRLREWLRQTTVHDKVVVAYSGHGLFNARKEYFLSTYDVDFADPTAKGLAYQDLESLLDSIPARHKLLLLDACHSGEVDREEMQRQNGIVPHLQTEGIRTKGVTDVAAPRVGLANSFELMQSLFTDVSRRTGTTVIAAAGGTQFALEKNSLKNGVFTSSILEMLRDFGNNNLDSGYDDITKSYSTTGRVRSSFNYRGMSIYELQRKVNKRVTDLTKGLQVPTTRAGLHSTNWEIW